MSASRFFNPQSRRFIILMGILTAQAALAVDVLLPALPAMVQDLGMTTTAAQLTVGFFIGGFAVGQIGWGWLSDWIGRRSIILIGTGGYAVSTFFCAVADNGGELIIWRLIMGIFASASVVVTRAMLRDHFSGVDLARKMAAMTTVFFLSPMLAPQFGTLIMLYGGWRSVFWIPGIISVICLIIVWRSLDESLPKSMRRRSSLLEIWHTANAMIRHPISGLCFAIQASMSAGLMAWISSSSLILTGYFAVPEQHFGLFFSATAMFQLSGTIISNRLLKRRSPSYAMGLGALSCAIGGTLIFMVTVPFVGPLWSMMLGMWIYMLGFGLIVPASGGMALHAFGIVGGLAAAMLGSVQSLVGSLGSVFSAYIYDGTPSSLGIAVGLSAFIACLMAMLLSYRLHKQPRLLDHPEDAKTRDVVV